MREFICNSCESNEAEPRTDYYGYYTGDWCEDCYHSSRYPYKKGDYFDPLYAGETLE